MKRSSLVFILSFFLIPSILALVPDSQECAESALDLRGDANHDEQLDLSDVVYLLNWLFKGGEAPNCLNQADVNSDGKIDMSDAITILDYLYADGQGITEIDKVPFLTMPSEVTLNLKGPILFRDWVYGNFQDDVLSCSSFANPTTFNGEDIVLFSFERDSANPVDSISDKIETVFDLRNTPAGEYEVKTTCVDLSGYEGTSITNLIINGIDNNENGNPDGESICQNGIDQCCRRSDDGLAVCITSPPGGPSPDDCENLKGILSGEFFPVDSNICNEKQDERGQGGTIAEPADVYCRVKCVGVFYGQGNANCGSEIITLEQITPYFKNQLGEEYDSENSWKSGTKGIGPLFGAIDRTYTMKTAKGLQNFPVKYIVGGYGYLAFAKYIPLDKDGKELIGGNTIDGKLCREYQFSQSISSGPTGPVYPALGIIPPRLIAELTGSASLSLYELWNQNNLADQETLSKQRTDQKTGKFIGYNDKDKECKLGGTHYCTDDYHQIRKNSDYLKEREWSVPWPYTKDLKPVDTLSKEYYIGKESFMFYSDTPGASFPNAILHPYEKKNNFLIIVEDQDIAGQVNHKIDCKLNGIGSSWQPAKSGILRDGFKPIDPESCICDEWQRKENQWTSIKQWKC
ncbi:MAG: dockerin type I repeat-containing protein [Nanoarchaeota archaeon]|nr:dockerin type I repeat-containing protein [Nanoarchaeota archaeon]